MPRNISASDSAPSCRRVGCLGCKGEASRVEASCRSLGLMLGVGVWMRGIGGLVLMLGLRAGAGAGTGAGAVICGECFLWLVVDLR